VLPNCCAADARTFLPWRVCSEYTWPRDSQLRASLWVLTVTQLLLHGSCMLSDLLPNTSVLLSYTKRTLQPQQQAPTTCNSNQATVTTTPSSHDNYQTKELANEQLIRPKSATLNKLAEEITTVTPGPL
jgi:hypothetical protein